MFGNMFSGMFGKGGPAPMQDIPDALGQASMGAPNAMGQGMPSGGWLSGLLTKLNAMDPMQKQMMMSRMGQGFSAGSSPFNRAVQQPRNVYQGMAQPQAPAQWFNPNGMR